MYNLIIKQEHDSSRFLPYAKSWTEQAPTWGSSSAHQPYVLESLASEDGVAEQYHKFYDIFDQQYIVRCLDKLC